MATLLRSSRSFLITGFDFEGRMECTSDTVSGLKWPRDSLTRILHDVSSLTPFNLTKGVLQDMKRHP